MQKTAQDGSISGSGTIEEMCGIRLLHVGRVRKTGFLNKMMLSTEHRKTEKKDEEKRLKRKARRDVGPEDTTVQPREGGPTVHNNWEMPKNFCTHGGRMELPPRSRTSTTS